jgi:hypothetical protein
MALDLGLKHDASPAEIGAAIRKRWTSELGLAQNATIQDIRRTWLLTCRHR